MVLRVDLNGNDHALTHLLLVHNHFEGQGKRISLHLRLLLVEG